MQTQLQISELSKYEPLQQDKRGMDQLPNPQRMGEDWRDSGRGRNGEKLYIIKVQL